MIRVMTRRCAVRIVTSAIALSAVSCGGSGSSATAGGGRFLLDPAPSGFERCEASEGSPFGVLPAAGKATEVWGDRAAPDPWAGLLVTASVDAAKSVPVHDDADPVIVRGHAGYVGAAQLFQGVSSAEWGTFITWAERPGLVIEVRVRRGTRSDALRIAEQAIVTDASVSFAPDALGTRTEVIARGRAVFPAGGLSAQRWSVVYQARRGAPSGPTYLGIYGLVGGSELIDVMRYWAAHTEPLSVRGTTGILYAAWDRSVGPWGALWQEPGGQVLQVAGYATEEETRSAVASIDAASADEWTRATSTASTCSWSVPR